MRHSARYIFALPLVSALLVLSCDSADGPTNVLRETPKIDEFSVEPGSLDFSEQDALADTLVTFHITAKADLPDDYSLKAIISSAEDRSELESTLLESDPDAPEWFSGSLSLMVSTDRFESLLLYVYPTGPDGLAGNRAETTITVTGFDTGIPEVLNVEHPDTLTIPAEGESPKPFAITARVSHTVSMDYIDRVSLQLTNGINFVEDMQDDHEDFDNEPGDSIYISTFSIDSDNQPATYTVNVHAIDITGTSSDTLRSKLTLTR